jgi:Rad3-related DNA helicase
VLILPSDIGEFNDSIEDADIVFLSHDVLLDPRLAEFDLGNAIIILNDVHEPESVCGESVYFELTAADLSMCIKEADRGIELSRGAPVAAEFAM